MISVILNNGHVLNPESITLEPHMVFSLTDWDQFIELVDQLEGENLLHLQVVKDDAPVASFTDCELVGTQTVNNHDGTLTAHFYMIGVPEAQTDPDYETAYKIMAGEVQA